MSKIGYARVSTQDQDHALQEQALKKAGCDRVFMDTISGKTSVRPGLEECLAALQEGDTLVVWKLDRLGRRIVHLKEMVERLHARGIGFQSVMEEINTKTAVGKMFFHLLCVFAEFERDLISERTKAGLAATKANGTRLGRPREYGYSVDEVSEMLKTMSVREIAATGIAPHSAVARISAAQRA